MQQHELKVQRTAHYYTLGEANQQTRYFIIACHGYAQLARHFLRRFDCLMNEETFILAPEGLSRFYWKGLTGDVVASWMTKENRLAEIEDYTNYLQALYEQYRAKMPEDVRIQLLGFSQGCATQSRWLMAKKPYFHDLILWAGLLPEDIDYRKEATYLADKRLFQIYGTEDQYITPELIEWYKGFIHSQNIDLQILTYDGKHEVDRTVLQEMYQRIIPTSNT